MCERARYPQDLKRTSAEPGRIAPNPELNRHSRMVFRMIDKHLANIPLAQSSAKSRDDQSYDFTSLDDNFNVAERRNSSGGQSQRSKLAERLASRSDALVLLSATPHDGSRRSFASLMHRARWLAEHRSFKPTDRILFTTFTSNLAADI